MCRCQTRSLNINLPFLHISFLSGAIGNWGRKFKDFFFCILPTKKCIIFANAICSQLALVQVLALVSPTCGITSLASSVLIFKVGLIITLFHKAVLSHYVCLLSTNPVRHPTLLTEFYSTFKGGGGEYYYDSNFVNGEMREKDIIKS